MTYTFNLFHILNKSDNNNTNNNDNNNNIITITTNPNIIIQDEKDKFYLIYPFQRAQPP